MKEYDFKEYIIKEYHDNQKMFRVFHRNGYYETLRVKKEIEGDKMIEKGFEEVGRVLSHEASIEVIMQHCNTMINSYKNRYKNIRGLINDKVI